jgi:hypothetical protein
MSDTQNYDEVICPKCCHQFRAVPVNVQRKLAEARAERDKYHDALIARHGCELAPRPEPVKLRFPTMLRKMWSGTEVQDWIDRQGPLYAEPVAAPAENETLFVGEPNTSIDSKASPPAAPFHERVREYAAPAVQPELAERCREKLKEQQFCYQDADKTIIDALEFCAGRKSR